jgi:hypothetical protein
MAEKRYAGCLFHADSPITLILLWIYNNSFSGLVNIASSENVRDIRQRESISELINNDSIFYRKGLQEGMLWALIDPLTGCLAGFQSVYTVFS